MDRFDVIFIGAGIVGLASAYALLKKNPGLSIAFLEKEEEVALHQTGRNSGVIHSGIYYKPGSLKAKLTKEGRKMLLNFCEQESIPTKRLGKVIVATKKEELDYLHKLSERAKTNEIESYLIGQEELKEKEPFLAGLQAIFLPDVSIVSFFQVARALRKQLEKAGVSFFFKAGVEKIALTEGNAIIETKSGSFRAKFLVNSSGLFSDRVAKKCSGTGGFSHRILPFKGEYYELSQEARSKVHGLIYPVPDPKFPFLGVHFTPKIDGSVEAGPNAILSLNREGYTSRTPNITDVMDILTFKGFWKMGFRYAKQGIDEYVRSFSKQIFLRDLRRLIPSLEQVDLVKGKAGIRAQVVTEEGRLFDDFLLHRDQNVLHVLNAPSPAATASFAIGNYIAEMLDQEIGRRVHESSYPSGREGAKTLAHISQ